MANDEVRRAYGSGRWRKRARYQLRTHPLCVMCLNDGQLYPATVADHVHPHRGDMNSFWFGPLQSLCATHHSSSKQREESRGYSDAIGPDGFPIDPNHPSNR